MCFVLIKLDARPFLSSRIALMLSWYSVDLITSKHWLCRKYSVHNTCGNASCNNTTSLMVEIVVSTLCFFESLVTHTFLVDIIAPVHPFRSGCVPYYVSTHQWIKFK